MRRAILVTALLAIANSASSQAQGPPQSASRSYDVSLAYLPPAERKPVPMQRVGGLLVFRMEVAGTMVTAAIDNGTTKTMLDGATARALGIGVTTPWSQVHTPSGVFVVRLSRPTAFLIPGQITFAGPLVVGDLSAMSTALGRKIDMVIGADLIELYLFIFRMSAGNFDIGPPGSIRATSDFVAIPLVGNGHQVDLTIGGRSARLDIDMGSNDALALRDDRADRLVPGYRSSSRPTSLTDYTGSSQPGLMLTVGPVTIGDVPLGAVRAVVTTGLSTADGSVGMGLFGRGDFALDLADRKVWISRRAFTRQAVAPSRTGMNDHQTIVPPDGIAGSRLDHAKD